MPRCSPVGILALHCSRMLSRQEGIVAPPGNAPIEQRSEGTARPGARVHAGRVIGDALATAIITRPESVPHQTRKDLAPINRKYVK